MQIYARIQNGLVMEILKTDQAVESLFHPELVWVSVPEGQIPVQGSQYDGKEFYCKFEAIQVDETPNLHGIMVTLASIQEQLVALKGQAE